MSTSPTTTTGGSAHPSRPPMRNKSSSALSSGSARTATSSHSHAHSTHSHTAHRPKRNKSSTSLHAAGHHNVQFTHHSRKNSTSSGSSSKRTGSHSGGRKPAFGFGMTSLPQPGDHHSDDDEDHDHDEDDRSRPAFDRRGSSASTVVGGEQPRGRQRSADGRGSRSRSRAKSSPVRQTPETVEVTIHDVTPMATPPREEQHREQPSHLKKGGAMDKVVGSYQSTNGTTSDWESATDSPAPLKKELPEVARAYRQDTISGLGQVLGEGDRVASEEGLPTPAPVETVAAVKEEEKSRPTTPRRAKFEIDDSDDTPPSPEALENLQKIDQHPIDAPQPPTVAPIAPVAPGPTPATAPFASEPQSPVKEHELRRVSTPPERTTTAPAALQQQKSTVAFPSAGELKQSPTSVQHSQPVAPATAPVSPSQASHHRPRNARKSSNASLMSNASARSVALSFAGRMGPPAAHMFRRTASSVAPPSLDRSQVATAQMAGVEGEGQQSTAGPRNGHRRTESLNSMRSLRTVAEGGHVGRPVSPNRPPPRASTMGPTESRDAARRLRQGTGGSESSGALAALGNIQGANPAERRGAPTRSASGYFSALKGFTTGLTGLTPPLSPSVTTPGGGVGPGGRYPIPGAVTPGLGGGPSARGKQRASPSPAQFAPPVVSKFVEPQDLIASQQAQQQQAQREREREQQLSASPAASSRFGPGARNASSASLSGGGAMSRTQQKALLARDAPYWSGTNSPAPGAPNGGPGGAPSGSGFYTPGQPGGAIHAPLPLPPPPATQNLSLTSTAPPPQSGKMARTASGGVNTYPAAAGGPGDQARQQGMQKWAYGLVREAERIERQYRAVEKWRDPLGEALERVQAARKEKAMSSKVPSTKIASPI